MPLEGKKILITGGAGFIGSTLAARLADNNDIVIYDNLRRDALKYTDVADHPNVTFVQGDILDKNGLKKAGQDCSIVAHLAAVAGVTSYNRWPVETMRINMLGTFNVLEVFAEQDIELLVNLSTSEVYGPLSFDVKETDITSQGEAKAPRWSYSVSKLAAEHMSMAFFRTKDLPVVSLRPFNVYGPRQVGEGAIPIFLLKAMQDQTIQVTGDGNQIRAWCHIDDFIEGLIGVMEHRDKCVGEVINIGNPRGATTILGLVEKVIRLTESKSKIEFIPHPSVDIKLRVPNIERAGRLIGYKPKIDVNQGLLKTIPWYREHMDLIIKDESA